MIDYYEMFSEEITPNMSAEAIWQVLDKQDNIYARRLDMKSAEKRELIAQALKVFQSEESKQAYDRQLAESRQEPAGPPDPRQKKREELERWKASAQKYLDRKKYDLAKSAIERALPLDKDRSDWKLYRLAAQIYKQNGDYSAALRYINDAIVLEPEDAILICKKAAIYNARANSLTKDSHFSSSPELREKYQEIRREALALYQEARSLAEEQEISWVLSEVLGDWAASLYFSPDQTNKEQARKDRLEGERLAQEALMIDISADAQLVLQNIDAKTAEQRKWTRLARTRRDKGEYQQAHAALAKALEYEDDVPQTDGYLYWLAASINYSLEKYDTALGYIDKALALEPKDVYDNVLKGMILDHNALVLSNDSLSSSSKLRTEYRNLRNQALAMFQKAVDFAKEQKDANQQAYALGHLAFTLYFRSNAIDPNAAREERRMGVEMALKALRLGKSGDAQKVLRDFDEKVGTR